jgi:hypothetical protein
MRTLWSTVGVLLAIAACDGGPNEDAGDVVGPFVGPAHRYVVDGVALPRDDAQGVAFGDDLTGRGAADNALAGAMIAFGREGDVTTHARDMIAAGRLASSVVLQTDDLQASAVVGVSYVGADGDDATPAGGQFTSGMLATNRTRSTQHPGTASVRLPMFADADPIDVRLDGFELDLTADASGSGYTGLVRGGVPGSALADLAASIVAMLRANPAGHVALARLLDGNRDGVVSAEEVVASGILADLFAPDVAILDDEPVFSVGFQVHLAPCVDGDCALGGAFDHCADRVRDADETDLDCGGSCLACPFAASCGSSGDCQSGTCTGGACTAPSCHDGIKNGFESDVDCGESCGACEIGQACAEDTDCVSTRCSGDAVFGGAPGVCLPISRR